MEEIFLSLKDVPVDENIPEDGDNRLAARKEPGDPSAPFEREALRRARTPRRLVPPLKRLLKRGMKGKDVEALQRALKAAKATRINPPAHIYGPGTMQAVKRFQRENNLEVDGVYGPKTHAVLAPHYDAYGAWLITGEKVDVSPEEKMRSAIVDACILGYNLRAQIHYTMGNLRMWGVRNRVKPPSVPKYEDCSSFATWVYWVSGAADPNGRGYDGYGYTGTLALKGTRTNSPRPGNLGFYGSYPYGHVVIYVGEGKCVSHGSEGGPYLLYPNYRNDFSHWRTYF